MSAPAQEPTATTRAGSGITIEDLRIGLTSRPGVDVVDDIDLVLRPGEVVGLVGESGSGKTTVGTALLGYTRPGAAIEQRQDPLRGQGRARPALAAGAPAARRGDRLRPAGPGVGPQPRIRIGRQIVELMELRGLGTTESRLQGARDGLAEVGLPNDDEFLRRYSHQLSGGQVQRVALAMAFLPKPKVLVLDEPTTGLDVTTQGMVLQTMGELCRTHGVAALYVTHDLAVIANIADRVAVMYAGQIAELGERDTIFNNPTHPYTRALLDSIPHLSQARALSGIPGRTPAPGARPSGCRFNDRCEFAIDECRAARARAATRSRPGTACAASGPATSAPGTSPAARFPTPTPTSSATSSSASTTSASSTATSRSSSTSPSTSARPRSSRWWASPAPARPRSPAAWVACTRSGPVRSSSRATSSATARASAASTTASGSSTSSRTPTCR